MKNNKYIATLLLVFLFTISAVAQQKRTITGLVVDERNEPVIGASITVPGTTNGTITNIDGKFSLTNIEQSVKLIQVTVS